MFFPHFLHANGTAGPEILKQHLSQTFLVLLLGKSKNKKRDVNVRKGILGSL